jgi:glycolate oxidase iron-sulfur subunit
MSQPARPAPAGPTPDRARQVVALADQCVQCGLCLPACPTYRFEQLEAESPRGRIALARAWTLDIAPPTPAGDRHLDHCLGCRRCEVVCPAGVQYGPLLIAARSRQRERRRPGWKQPATEWVAARPRLLHALLRLYRLAFPILPAALRPLPRPGAPIRIAPSHPAGLAVFIGCVAGPYEGALRAALVRLCAALDVELSIPRDQACCGSLHAHAGNTAAMEALAARNREAFASTPTVLTLASGCHEAVATALHGTARTLDALDFIAEHADRLRFRAAHQRIALHLPCTQRNVVKSDAATRALLARVPGLEVIELDAGFGCCGASGTQMLVDPERAAAYRQPLLEQFEATTGATRLLSANIGCRLHFANGTRLPVQHPLEFLAECLEP